MRVDELLELTGLRFRLLTDAGGRARGRELRWVYATDLLEPARFLRGGELVLTSEGWYRSPDDCDTFAASLAQGGAAALVAGDILLGEVPPRLVSACERHGIPVLTVPPDISYGSVSRTVIDRINRERGLELADVLGRHRRLVAALVEGADLGHLVAMLGAELGTDCWALSLAGRVLAGPADPLPLPLRTRLAAAALRAVRLPATHDGHALFPIGRRGAGAGHLVLPGEHTGAAAELAAQTAELLALGGARRDERRRSEHRFHAEVVDLIASGAPTATLRARLHTAGLTRDRPLLVLTARTHGTPHPPHPWDLAADLAESVLDDDPDARTVVASTEDGMTLLTDARFGPGDTGHGTARTAGGSGLPADGDADGGADAGTDAGGGTDADLRLAERLRNHLEQLAPAAAGGRLAFGLSTPAPSAGDLPRALEEARHAARLAEGSQPLALGSARDLHSHLSLLAGVPLEVRASYQQRLLGPLRTYDADHGTDLLGTLRAFLEANGAWRATAAQLHVHVSTLHYRIGRIQQLTGRDLRTARDRVDLYLACALDGR